MTNRSFLKCDVCGAVTLMRLQVGWLDEHPVRIPCGKCGILVSGTVYFDQANAKLRYEIHNASEVGEAVPDFYLMPAFALRFYQKTPKNLNKLKGATTAIFEDIKGFYSDTFEVLTEMLPLVAAYNNLRHRGDFGAMKNLRKDVVTLEDFITKSKGERLAFVGGAESFDRLLNPGLDNKLRNAIAHASYREDFADQRITYYPAGVMGKGQAKRLYLLDVLRRCWTIFYCTVDMLELQYQTQKLYSVIVLGNRTVHPSVFRE